MARHTDEVERAAHRVDAARRRLEGTREQLYEHRKEFNASLIHLERTVAEQRRQQSGRRA